MLPERKVTMTMKHYFNEIILVNLIYTHKKKIYKQLLLRTRVVGNSGNIC